MMIGVLFLVVLLRYAFNIGWIGLQESVLWLHAAVFLLTAAWTLAEDGHVRVDVFYHRFSRRTQGRVNVLGTLLLLLPFAGFMLYACVPYVLRSWKISESSFEAGGLPAIYLLKTLLPIAAVLLLLQGLIMLLRSWREARSATTDTSADAT
jgi:TRAP-type mannitol/chloroaromatic compound transport system permease small subunit